MPVAVTAEWRRRILASGFCWFGSLHVVTRACILPQKPPPSCSGRGSTHRRRGGPNASPAVDP
eukprot:4796347-Prymnesium_polylepis.1